MGYKAQHEARRNHLVNLGLEPDVEGWRYKWNNLVGNCRARPDGVECRLSFEDYTRLAAQAGLKCPSQISRAGYQLGRVGDIGHYEMGNCRFITHTQNIVERALNGGTQRISEKVKAWRNRVVV